MSAVVLVLCLALAGVLMPPSGATRLRGRLSAVGAPDQTAPVGMPSAVDGRRPPAAARIVALAFAAVACLAAGVPATLTVVGGVGVVLLTAWWRRAARRRAAMAAEGLVVDVVFALAAELRAGRPPGDALSTVAATSGLLRHSLTEAAAAVAAGAAPPDELARIAGTPGCGALAVVAAAWSVTLDAGGALADVLDRLGEVLDADEQARRALAAAMAGPRATMAMLALLPAVGLALGQSLGARPVHLLVHEPIGWAIGGAALLCDGAGVLWTGLLTKRALR